jgi:hypothetical protein
MRGVVARCSDLQQVRPNCSLESHIALAAALKSGCFAVLQLQLHADSTGLPAAASALQALRTLGLSSGAKFQPDVLATLSRLEVPVLQLLSHARLDGVSTDGVFICTPCGSNLCKMQQVEGRHTVDRVGFPIASLACCMPYFT